MGLWSTYLLIELVSFEAFVFFQSEVNIPCEKDVEKKMLLTERG